MPVQSFHPAVAQWFGGKFAAPTAPQERGWPSIQAGRHTLIAAPTGSGKTLAAFLASLDRLFKLRLAGALGDETKVVYVSPLKALSNDIHRNLSGPLAEIQAILKETGCEDAGLRVGLRTGDTPASARRAIVKNPPHILVTTPESLYLMLTSESGRNVLATADTLIIDEIHALADNRRGAHLSLSVERLDALTPGPLQRIGLSATQRPMETVANILVGVAARRPDGAPDCDIIDEGHLKELDIALEIPDSPLEAVMANEVWLEVYDRLVQMIEAHKTTLIFVNTRRLAERITFNLSHRLGEDQVASHHGSLSVKMRHRAEERLKNGDIKAVAATASLELGIDIGDIELVCQIGSPRAISAFLQRVGRSGHHLGGVPKGRLFPLTRDELVECAALLRAVKRGELDKLVIQEKPRDVLAQQIVAETACDEWREDDLLAVFRNAWLYRDLSGDEFGELVQMLSEGITTKRGRRGAHVYYDGVNRRIKGRKGARLAALTCGGAIPDLADYNAIQEPEGLFIGTLNEDFAVESLPGDIFQLGNHSWRILKVETGVVRVADAEGQPPTIPFWFGEAPGRTRELSQAVSQFRQAVADSLEDMAALDRLLDEELNLTRACRQQLVDYLAAGHRALGAMPTQETLVVERFFDEAGGMQLVIHSPFGSRLNRAWGLALRKRFCRSFNFELQAAATEDAIVLSLGPKHSFPLETVFQFLNSKTARDVLVQALLDAPMFQTRWRWNASRALAMLRQRGGKRVPPQIQRMESEDLIAVVFPDQLACLENIVGEREPPDHPLVKQTIEDCLQEAMDIDELEALLSRIEGKTVQCVAVDLPEPSPLCHEVLTAKPYAFLDDAPAEERRTLAVNLKRTLEPAQIRDKGVLDQSAVEQVRTEAWPLASNDDEVHEALLLLGGMRPEELAAQRPAEVWRTSLARLAAQGRAGLFSFEGDGAPCRMHIVAERLPQWRAAFPEGAIAPEIEAPERERRRQWDEESALVELLRGRLELCGPTTGADLAAAFGMSERRVETALLALEGEGMILRGHFDEGLEGQQWCNRRLLARIHHLTVRSLRDRVKPVTIQAFMRFLFYWQRVDPENHARELDGLGSVIELLEGFEAAAGSWEKDLLPARVQGYMPLWLDNLCMLGRVSWGRITPPGDKARFYKSGPLKTTPIGLFLRQNADLWLQGAGREAQTSAAAAQVMEALRSRGAMFFEQLAGATGLLESQLEQALGELTALGLVHSDSFSGLRSLLLPSNKKPPLRLRQRRGGYRRRQESVEFAGRWALLQADEQGDADGEDWAWAQEALERRARILLHRYGVVFRRLLARETHAPPWRDLIRVYRHWEAIGEIRGGRFVEGCSGEQFASPEALAVLRSCNKRAGGGQTIAISAVDPLNLTGVLFPGPAISQLPGNRIIFEDGAPATAWEGGKMVQWPRSKDTSAANPAPAA